MMNTSLKNRLLITFVIILTTMISLRIKAQVKITDGSVTTIDSNSLLEMESDNKGLLVPRVAISSFTQCTPLTAPVPAGMMIYSRSGLIPDGFYFWNGSRWISMGISEVPVLKTSDCTLLKSETLVTASGDINVTLPVVAAADNGLSITVKNTGTYLDLVNVTGNSGATIDGRSAIGFTRWQGSTFIAWNGNWITGSSDRKTANFLEVSPVSSFTTIAEVVTFLNSHMSGPTLVRLGPGEYEIASMQTIDLPWPVTFQGISFGETTVKATAGVAGNPLFNCISESYFKMLTFEAISNAPGNDGIRFTGAGTYHEVKDAYFTGFHKAIVSTTNNDLLIFELDIKDCAGAGLEIDAGTAEGGQMRVSETDFFQCGTGINLLSGVSETISIVNCTFYNRSSDTGVLYQPDTFISSNNLVIANNGWNNEGTMISGFDFSRADGRDADAYLIANVGEEDAKPHFKINVINNALTTNISSAGTYYKAQWTNTSSYQNKWNISNNKCTYLSSNSSDGWAVISGNLSTNSINRVITIAIVKNGVITARFGETSLRVTTANQPFQFSTVIYLDEIYKDDYLELFVTSNNSSDVVTFQDVHWFTDSH